EKSPTITHCWRETALPTSKRWLAGEPSGAKISEALVAMGATVRLRLDFGGKTECPGSGKDRLAALVVDQHGAFEEALAGAGSGIRRVSSGPSPRRYDSMQTPLARTKCYTEVLSGPLTGWSSICGANARGCRTRSWSKRKDWNVCSFSATIRTSTATSLLVCDLACQHFGKPIASIAGMKPTSQPG